MQVLIVEDNAFNAFCLARLLTTVDEHIHITITHNSQSALHCLSKNTISFVIIDGDLGAYDNFYSNGPELVKKIWQNIPHLPVVIWSDSEHMRKAFHIVFTYYNKPLNEYTCWKKRVSLERIRQSLPYLMNLGTRSFSS